MRFVWFWTFWHWSKEGFRAGSLLRSPLHGIGSHWDEWFRHEASESDRHAVDEVGRTESSQREFIAWLLHYWAQETGLRAKGVARHFVLEQLGRFSPFKEWAAFDKYRGNYGVGGIPAVVLAEESPGESDDIRPVEAIALPADVTAPAVLTDGFQVDATELETSRSAAISLLRGKGLLIFLWLWITGGQRPYSEWLRIGLRLGWLALAGLILFLVLGPDPGDQLVLLSGVLLALWSGLMLVASFVVISQSFRAWRTGLELSGCLEQSQVRLRMSGGLTLKGGSAGLPFCLNTLLALSLPGVDAARRSWMWHRFFGRLRSESESWAATGVITADGSLKPVVIEPKLRACLKNEKVRELLTPRQNDAGRRAVDRLINTLTETVESRAPAKPPLRNVQLGFAAEKPQLRVHPCRHIAQCMMVLGGFRNRGQMGMNIFALGVSAIMLIAAPDLRSILLPHQPPIAVPPSSLSPYELWISLDTKRPEYFSVVLESGYWSNRRSDVKWRGGVAPSVRGEIHFHRLIGMSTGNENDGDVWIERRRRFLTREFNPGERVGRYSLAYLSHLGHE